MDAVMDRYTTTKSPIRWMPFIGTRGWATYHCSTGTWIIDETMLRHTLGNVRDDVAAAGYLMVDWEAFSDHPNPCNPASDPAQNVADRIDRMVETAQIVSSWLDGEFGACHDVGFGFYRVPDHKHPAEQTGNAYVDVLAHTNTVFITLHTYDPQETCFNNPCKTPEPCDSSDCAWRRYQCRVECSAPNHEVVAYFFGAADSGGCQCVEPACSRACADDCCYTIAQMEDRFARIDEFFPGCQLVVRGRTVVNAPGAMVTARNWLFDLQNACPSDINGDRHINVLDLIDLLLCFGQPAVPGCEAQDVTGDGVVNELDLIQLLLDFGQACPEQPVEEVIRAASGPDPPARRRRISTYLRDMPSIRLLDLTNLVALSPAKHFFNGLLGVCVTRRLCHRLLVRSQSGGPERAQTALASWRYNQSRRRRVALGGPAARSSA